VTDAEGAIIAPLVSQSKHTGRPVTISRRALLNAIFYITKTGCGWEWLPRDFPRWKTVYHYFFLWQRAGVWHAIHTALRTALPQASGRNAQPSAAIIDSQSVKTTSVGGPCGYDGGKKIKGRKRHLLVDTQGLVLTVKVHDAGIPDRDGAQLVLDGVATDFHRITGRSTARHLGNGVGPWPHSNVRLFLQQSPLESWRLLSLMYEDPPS
jgi:transposase